MKNIYKFLRSPYSFGETEGFRNKTSLMLKSLGIAFCFMILLAVLHLVVIHIFELRSFIETKENYNGLLFFSFKELGSFAFILFGCVIGPLIEETAFRLPFSFKLRHVQIGLPFFSAYIYLIISNDYSLTRLLIVPIVATIVILKMVNQEKLNNLKERYRTALLHIVAITFALMHLSNYGEFSISNIPSYIFFIGQILIMSYTLFYVRIRSGYIYAVALHVTANTFMLSNYWR